MYVWKLEQFYKNFFKTAEVLRVYWRMKNRERYQFLICC